MSEISKAAALETQRTIDTLVADKQLAQVMTDYHALRRANGEALPDLPEYQDLPGLEAALRIAADFRTGPDGEYRERWEVTEQAERYLTGMPDELMGQISQITDRYGLTGSTSHANPNKAAEFILGGGGAAPRDRSVYAARQMAAGKLVTPQIIGLGSQRAVNEAELGRAGDYAVGAQTEEDLVRFGLAHAFGLDPEQYTVEEREVATEHPDVPNLQRIGRLAARDLEVIVVSAAVITDPYMANGNLRNRANTTDSLQTVVNEQFVRPGDEVGLVTNAIYVFQAADARNVFGEYGVKADVIGFDPSEFGYPSKEPYELMQEMLTLAERL